MGMVIIPGRNSGYPFAEGLPDTPSLVDTPPYHEYYMRISPERNNGYPAVMQVPLVGTLSLAEPYPDAMFHILGEDFNDGYPLLLQLHGITREMFSDVYFAGDRGEELFFDGQKVIAGYCNGQKVYGMRYISQQ